MSLTSVNFSISFILTLACRLVNLYFLAQRPEELAPTRRLVRSPPISLHAGRRGRSPLRPSVGFGPTNRPYVPCRPFTPTYELASFRNVRANRVLRPHINLANVNLNQSGSSPVGERVLLN